MENGSGSSECRCPMCPPFTVSLSIYSFYVFTSCQDPDAFSCCIIRSLRLNDNQTIASMTGISISGPTTVEDSNHWHGCKCCQCNCNRQLKVSASAMKSHGCLL